MKVASGPIPDNNVYFFFVLWLCFYGCHRHLAVFLTQGSYTCYRGTGHVTWPQLVDHAVEFDGVFVREGSDRSQFTQWVNSFGI